MVKAKPITILLIFLNLACFAQTANLLGKYSYSRGKGRHGSLILKKNNNFIQNNGNCTWRYLAKGKWNVKHDTIYLTYDKLYNLHGDGKKILADTSCHLYKIYNTMNTYYINADTLQLLIYRSDKTFKMKFDLYKKK